MKRAAHGLTKHDMYAYKYQINSWDTMLKTLFSELHKFHVLFNYPGNFSNKKGSFVAV